MDESKLEKYDNTFDQFEAEIRESLCRFKRDILGVYAFCCVTEIIAIYFLIKYV